MKLDAKVEHLFEEIRSEVVIALSQLPPSQQASTMELVTQVWMHGFLHGAEFGVKAGKKKEA